MSGDLVTKQDLEHVEARLDRRIDGVEAKLDIVARQVAVLTGEVGSLREEMGSLRGEVGSLRGEMGSLQGEVGSLREEMGSLREDMNRDIARHMEAGFEMMRQLFTAQDDRARSIEEKLVELRHDFSAHTHDFVLHNRP